MSIAQKQNIVRRQKADAETKLQQLKNRDIQTKSALTHFHESKTHIGFKEAAWRLIEYLDHIHKEEKHMLEKGPIYGAPLRTERFNIGGMYQAVPTSADLYNCLKCNGGHRVVGAYEVACARITELETKLAELENSK